MNRSMLLVGIGILVLIASFSFLSWGLTTYPVTATAVESPDDDPEAQNVTVVDFNDLDSESQSLVKNAVEHDGAVTVYGRWYAHQTENGMLPPIIENNWLDSYTLGSYVHYEEELYKIAAPVHGEPFHIPLIQGGGLIVGFALIGMGGIATTRDWENKRIYFHSGVWGGLAVGCLGLLGNIHGYLWLLLLLL